MEEVAARIYFRRGNECVDYQALPLFECHDLHSQQLKNTFKLELKPIFKKMVEAPGLNIPYNTDEIDEAFVQSSYVNAAEFFKSRFSYIFKEPKGKVAT